MTMMKILVLLALVLVTAESIAAEIKYARACVKATQTERGRMKDLSIAETSGYRDVDRFALDLVKIFRLELKRSETAIPQTGYAVVDYFEDGSFATSLFLHKGRLIRGCNDPEPLDNGFGT